MKQKPVLLMEHVIPIIFSGILEQVLGKLVEVKFILDVVLENLIKALHLWQLGKMLGKLDSLFDPLQSEFKLGNTDRVFIQWQSEEELGKLTRILMLWHLETKRVVPDSLKEQLQLVIMLGKRTVSPCITRHKP